MTAGWVRGRLPLARSYALVAPRELTEANNVVATSSFLGVGGGETPSRRGVTRHAERLFRYHVSTLMGAGKTYHRRSDAVPQTEAHAWVR